MSNNFYGIRAKRRIPPSVNVTEGNEPTCSASTSECGNYCNLSAGTAIGNIVNYDTVVVACPTVVWRKQLRQYFVFMRATRNVTNIIKNK